MTEGILMKAQNMKHKTSAIALILALAILGESAMAATNKKAEKEDSVEAALRFQEGDEDGNEVKALKTEMLVLRAEKKALQELQKLLKKHKGTPMEPEIVFRMAEMYMRRARSHRFFEVHKESEKVLSLTPTLVKEASEAKQIRQAISTYNDLVKRFPNYRNMDLVIFNTAYAYQQLGDDKQAETLFTKITDQYPHSPLVPDSFLAVGEINYNKRLFAKALESFKSVAKYPSARAYPYGLYKAAWCFYNMQDGPSALAQLEVVVKYGRIVADRKLDSKLDLRKEALNDMALFFSDIRPAKEAVEYFVVQAEGLDAAPILLHLVALYNRHSKYNDVETVLLGMLGKLPGTSSEPEIREQLVWNYEAMRSREKAVAQLSDLADYCKKIPVEKKQTADKTPQASQVCTAKVADASKKLAIKWHAYWKKRTPTDDLAAASEKAYRIYLDNGAAAADPDIAKIRFSYAEILFQRQKFREASEQYALVQDSKPDLKLGHDAAYASVVSLEKATDNKWSDVDEKLFQKLAQIYLTNYPKGEWVSELEFKRAFIAYEKNRYDEAGQGFKKIGWTTVINDKNKERVLKSQDLYLDILNVKKDFTGLKAAASALVNKGISDPTRMTSMQKIYREAYFSELQQMEEKGDLKGAVSGYKKFALENKDSNLSSKAWWNASQLEFKMGDVQAGAATCNQMYKLFPTSSNGKDCLTKAAQTYEASARLEPAAKVLLNLAEADSANAEKWRELAANFFALSGDRDRAKDMYLKLAEGKKPSRQLELYEKTIKLEELDSNTKGVNQIEQKILALGLEPSTSLIQLKQADSLLEKKDMTEAFALARKVLNKGVTKETKARARFIQAEVLDSEFREQSVKSRVDRIAMVLGLKTEKLEKAQKAYQETIKYGDPKTSIESLRRLSAAYLHYVEAIRNMPMSQALNEADQQAMKTELDNLAIPMEEKGIDTLAQALDAAKKSELYDETVMEIQIQLNALNKQTSMKPAQVNLPPMALPSVGNSVFVGVGL
jgi:tetratricopeptide (TPR) repeat protein